VSDDSQQRPIDAVRALRSRGIGNAEDLLEYGTPDEILAACRRWDSREGVGPGLLARWIRDREFVEEPAAPQSKAVIMRARFDEYAARFPVGAVAERHADLQARRWPEDDPCPGDMVVIETTYPLVSMECDQCGFVAALGPRQLHVLGEQQPLPRHEAPHAEQPF
jgi:hypothetical protein